ncbi:MAG: hypothetical protein ABJF04_09275 [Reichenbachiella sp.]|uniref:hypothetical protein n=1 Tax=Reichenbachiella sp. TaxID=2184521 RepID=UPI0032635B44
MIDIANSVVHADLPQPSKPKALIRELSNVGSYDPYSSIQQQNNQRVMADVDAHLSQSTSHQKRVNALINHAATEFYKPQIRYSLPLSRKPGKELFYEALNELAGMLKGGEPVSLKRAVYLVEHAYDPTIPFDHFDNNIKEAASHILMKLDQDGFDASDNLAKNMMIFRYMADTLEVKYEGIEQPVITYPMSYDFDDFWGRRDYSKMFVSKLIRDGTGQCHSLPLLYLLIAEEIGADANLAFAPNHSYIKFKDSYGTWQSLELTAGAISSENFIIQGGFVKSEALKSKIYLEPLTKKQLIAQTVNDLVLAYTRKYGHDDDDFFKLSTSLVYEVFPNNITTHQILANYYLDRLNYVIRQYKEHEFSKEQFEQDQEAQSLVASVKGANKYIQKLGYADMPEEVYSRWLESVKEKASGQYSNVKMEQLNDLIKK